MDDVERGIRRKIGAGLSVRWQPGEAHTAVFHLGEFCSRVRNAMRHIEFFWPDAEPTLRAEELPDGSCRVIWEVKP